MTATDVLIIVFIGLAGGVSGGLLGIGGSIVMIPLLTLSRGPNQHLYQAACMIVNVVVAVGASIRHFKGGTIRRDYFRWMLLAAAIAVIVGVVVSNVVESNNLKMLFGVFLIYTGAAELGRVLRREPDAEATTVPASAPRAMTIGGLTGFVSGLLGIGGGTVAVPLLRSLARLPMRQAIGTSAAVMTLASTVGAVAKNATIDSHSAPDGTQLTLWLSLGLAGLLTVPALFGAVLGAHLTYRLPLNATRLVFVALIALAGLRMMGVLG
ncbi:MAG: sulfite exporter TauE/SafE family protein [Phycisphaerae bacterium]|nr:sulfite exporter TauE/SafE family protein [Phycisphaerae bacterium]